MNYFQVRLDHAKSLNATPSMDEKIELYRMTEDVLWADLDRYMRVIKYFSFYSLSFLMLKVEL